MERVNRGWTLKQRPAESLVAANLDLVNLPVPEVHDGEVLLRNQYLSLDPTNRIWMSDRDQYLPPVGLGEVMRGTTISLVENSRSSRFAAGDLVVAQGGWQEYAVIPEHSVGRIRQQDRVPLTAHLSVLGATGITAYFGLLDICKPASGETLAVSAAAGAVGSIVGQIAKIRGCHVVGIAGGADKCRWIVEDLGFDAAVDYKSEDVGAALDRFCPGGIDMNFENVGGPVMDAVFSRLNVHGRMALCGMISCYNEEGPMRGPPDFGRILMKRITVRGFIVTDYWSRAREAQADLSKWIAEGRIKWKDHVVDGLDQAPEALGLLFAGANEGKLVLKIS